MENQKNIEKLQNEVKHFLTIKKLNLNGLIIIPKETEVYYYREGEFEDPSVHRNELQKNHKNHFYIHRWGTRQSDSYKGGNYPGIDFVVSDDANVYYSYLIRSALVNDKMVIGPHKVLEAIETTSKLTYEQIENSEIEVVDNYTSCTVLFSCRINLGKTVPEKFRNCELRAVLCDESFKDNKYPAKEKMVVNYLLEKVLSGKMSNTEASNFANKNLGYIPSTIKNL
jgi:hypothetical protein